MRRVTAVAVSLSRCDRLNHMSQKDYFALLNQPQTYAVDSSSLESAKNALLSRLHPDRFVNCSALEKRLAQQLSVQINEAYRTLSDDLLRAQYLCKLRGYDVNDHRPMSESFLMRQMQCREALEACEQSQDETMRLALLREVQNAQGRLIETIRSAFDDQHNDLAAFEATRELMFNTKLLAQIQH